MAKQKSCAVIGSGPNGLAAAIRMAQAGYQATVYEAESQIGGGCTSMELTLPGFVHDHCSAIHPLGVGSPYFRTLPLAAHGLEWIHPDAPLAHPLDDGSAALLERSVAATCATLGEDANAYARLFAPLIPNWDTLCSALLKPLRAVAYPLGLARFGIHSVQPAKWVANRHFRGAHARALFAGLAAHSLLPLEAPPSAAFAMALGIMGHAVGWPFPRGGSQKLTDALVGVLQSLGGQVQTGRRIDSLDELSGAEFILADVAAHNLPKIAGDRLPASYRSGAENMALGPGVFKVDYALDGPVPWRAKECLRAGTLHLGGTLEEIAESEAAVARGEHPARPFVLFAQQSLFDSTRAPDGKHTGWAYCHVPPGSDVDMTAAIDSQIERFAPGFSQRILARRITSPGAFEQRNANLIGGDITGGAHTLPQMIARPVLSANPWATGAPGLYLCSASTPPAGGVHGMCGYYAAQSALGELWKSLESSMAAGPFLPRDYIAL